LVFIGTCSVTTALVGVVLFTKVDGLSDLQALRLLEEFSNE